MRKLTRRDRRPKASHRYVYDKTLCRIVEVDLSKPTYTATSPALHIYSPHYNWSAGEVFNSRTDEKAYMTRTGNTPVE